MPKCNMHESECKRCHKTIQSYGNQKYCPECAAVVLFEKNHSEEYYQKHRAYKERRKLIKQLSEEPRKTPELTADEVSRQANAAGLSYGQYSARHGLYASVYGRAENGL